MNYLYKVTFLMGGESKYFSPGEEAAMGVAIKGILKDLVHGSLNLETALKMITVALVQAP
jgi:hypothetical protein